MIEESSTLFLGASRANDLREALEDAIAAAKLELRTDFVEWTLVEASGQDGGFAAVRDLNVSIRAWVPRSVGATDAAGRPAREAPVMHRQHGGSGGDGTEIQVPVFLTGIVSRLTGVDFCMDGATHLLHTVAGAVRLTTSNAEAAEALDKASGTRLRITVAGYPVVGPECSHVNVYWAGPASELQERSGLRF